MFFQMFEKFISIQVNEFFPESEFCWFPPIFIKKKKKINSVIIDHNLHRYKQIWEKFMKESKEKCVTIVVYTQIK